MTDSASVSAPLEGAQPAAPAPRPAPAGHPLDAVLRPVLEEIDRERLNLRSELFFRIAAAVLGAGVVAVLALLAFVGALGEGLRGLHPAIYLIPLLVAAIPLGRWAVQPRRRYISAYKVRILPAIAGTLGKFEYHEKGRIEPGRLAASTLLPAHDTYKSEDMFRGVHKGVGVEVAEVELVKRRGSGRSRKQVTKFRGLFMLLTTEREVSGKTVVRRDAGSIGNWLAETLGALQRVRIGDAEFEKRFEVYATDHDEARGLVTSAFIERLAALTTHMGTDELQASFYGKQLFVMVPVGKDLFEPPSIFANLLEDTGIQRIARELSDVLAIVDVLKPMEASGAAAP